MKKISLTIIFILSLSFYTTASYAQSGKTITLNDFITAYLKNSYSLRLKYESLRKAKGAKLSAEAIDELSLTFDGGYTYANGIGGGASNATGNIFSSQVGLTKSFSTTGTTIQVLDGFGGGKILGNNGGGNSFSISVIQPVLQNFFGYLSRMSIAQAALSLKAAEINYTKEIEVTVSDAIVQYLSWIYYYKERDILKDIIDNNQLVFRQTQQQLRAGIAEVSDLEMSRVSVIQYQQLLSQNKANYDSIIYALNDYLEVSSNDKPDLSILNDNLKDIPDRDIDPMEIKTIKSLNYLLNSTQLSVDSARNMYLPNLDIVANYSNNTGDASYLASFSSGTNKNNVYLGFQFSMPLFYLNERGNEIQAIAAYQDLLLQRDQAVRDLIRYSLDLKNQIALMNEQLTQQKRYIQALTRQVESQTQQFRRGTLSLENLLTARNSLSNAKINQNTLQLQASQLHNQYLEIIDSLQEEYQNLIPEELLLP